MLLICQSFYCLSNIALFIFFVLLAYKQLRGLVLILYDSNQILDQIDKGLYSLCFAMSLLVIGLTVYPVEELMFLLKATKLVTEGLLVYLFIRLTEVDLTHPNTLKVLVGAVSGVLALATYRTSPTKLEYFNASQNWCIPP